MKICILGGGIGGLSAAIFLKEVGYDVIVYERSLTNHYMGAGIVCWPNASFILEELGVLKEVERVSGAIHRMNRYSKEGDQLGSLEIDDLNKLMGFSSYSVLHADLSKVLINKLNALEIPIYYDFKAVDIIKKDQGKVRVIFENGVEIDTEKDDVIVGADGRMNSIARQFVHGSNSPIFQGFINWVGVFESEQHVFDRICISDYWGIGERFGIVPVSSKKAYWAGGCVSRAQDSSQSENYKTELIRRFEYWPDPIERVIKGTDSRRINKIYVHDHDPIETWHKDNVVLLGDSAHAPLPTSGQGACQALEDAWHLANCLKSQSNTVSAFELFTQLRKVKTAAITMGGRQLAASIFNDNPEFCYQRNESSKGINYSDVVLGMAKGWSNGLPL